MVLRLGEGLGLEVPPVIQTKSYCPLESYIPYGIVGGTILVRSVFFTFKLPMITERKLQMQS